MEVNRRSAIATFGATGLALYLDRWLAAQTAADPMLAGGRLARTLPLGRFDGRPKPPLHILLGSGLDARQFTDLSELSDDQATIPTERFFVRTSAPPSLPSPSDWSVLLGSPAGEERAVSITQLRSHARPMGTHLMECSGNADPANFGLLSAASWRGVSLAEVLEQLPSAGGATRIRVTGVDDDLRYSETSVPGASWVFTREEIERTGAFLATHMNDALLTPDHGAPVRLVVPNYYGCSCIKWVSRIDWVSDEEPATLQMREFAARTHQDGVPRLAREFEPPAIDVAATPIRLEEWDMGDTRGGPRPTYRVVGLRWGGTQQRVPLTIRFRHTEPFVPVGNCPDSRRPSTWTLWSHIWRPSAAGRYTIALRSADPSIRTRRLDVFFYARETEIG